MYGFHPCWYSANMLVLHVMNSYWQPFRGIKSVPDSSSAFPDFDPMKNARVPFYWLVTFMTVATNNTPTPHEKNIEFKRNFSQ